MAFQEGSAVIVEGLTLVSQEIVSVQCQFHDELMQAKPHEKGNELQYFNNTGIMYLVYMYDVYVCIRQSFISMATIFAARARSVQK